MEKRLIKTRLVLFRHNKDVALFVEYGFRLRLLHGLTHRNRIKALFRVDRSTLRRIFNLTRKRDHHLDRFLSAILQCLLQRKEISDRSAPRVSNNHHLRALKLPSGDGKESVDNNCALLGKVLWM